MKRYMSYGDGDGDGDGGLDRLLSESMLAVRRSTSARLRGRWESPRARCASTSLARNRRPNRPAAAVL